MNREVFTKKPERHGPPYAVNDTNRTMPADLPGRRPAIRPGLETFTPQKSEDRMLDVDDQMGNCNFSECDKLLSIQVPSPRFQRDGSYWSAAQNISHFIDSLSSGKSDMSFRSDLDRRPDRLNSQSTHYERNSKNGSLIASQPTHSLLIFQQPEKFKEQFVQRTQQFINSVRLKDTWNLEKLFSSYQQMPFSHPFQQRQAIDYKGLQTLESLMDKWIFEYSSYEKFILSFDFLFCHCSFLLIVIFYWSKLMEDPANPLMSKSEEAVIQQARYQAMARLLSILRDYTYHRSREFRNNGTVIRILREFYRCAKEQLDANQPEQKQLIETCLKSHVQLSDTLTHERTQREKLEDGNVCDSTHLQILFNNYREKSKMIMDNVEDLAELFCQLSRKIFINCPLTRFYQTGDEDMSKKQVGQRFTSLTCWLINLVFHQVWENKGVGWTAIKYLNRYMQLWKIFLTKRDYENVMLFSSVIFFLKNQVPKLWTRYLSEGRNNIHRQLEQKTIEVERMKLTVSKEEPAVVYNNSKIYQLVSVLRQKFKGKDRDLVNMAFHEEVQDLARRILALRKQIENQQTRLQKITANKTIKLNLNYRFLYHELFEFLKKREEYGSEQYEKLKKQSIRVNETLHFSKTFLSSFF